MFNKFEMLFQHKYTNDVSVKIFEDFVAIALQYSGL